MQAPGEVTQAEIDAAIVACLRIFAARGRAIRQERERLANAQRVSESAPSIPDAPHQMAGCGATVQEQGREEESAQNVARP